MEARVLLVFTLSFLSFLVQGRARFLERHIDLSHDRYKPSNSVTTIKSPDGDIIDCVIVTKQPAFNHPLLQNHVFQMEPSNELLSMLASTTKSSTMDMPTDESRDTVTMQVWHQTGQQCPTGTIPILRHRPGPHLRKTHGPSNVNFSVGASGTVPKANEHEYATVRSVGQYIGTSGSISVRNPKVATKYEFSLTQVWVCSGKDQTATDCIEAGWTINPLLYGDYQTRLFIFWTADFYESTGCYNLACEGFIQVNKDLAMGAALTPQTSALVPKALDIKILKDATTANWWLAIDGKMFGYWPAQLFQNMKDYAIVVEWGGEIINHRGFFEIFKHDHTKTQMGSGEFPESGFMKASWISDIQAIAANNATVLFANDAGVKTLVTERNCYDIQPFTNKYVMGFLYGGPGRNPKCP